MKIIPKSECIWCIRKGDEYTTRYKSGHKDTTLILPDEIDDDNFSIFVVEDTETIIIYLNRKYIFMNAITKDYSINKGYRLSEGIEKKKMYANFTMNTNKKERYICMRY